MRVASLCDIGKIRKINQDHIYTSMDSVGRLPNVFIVADGMGGHNAGEMASRLAIEYFIEFIKDQDFDEEAYEFLLKRGIEKSNRRVYEKSLEDESYTGMGTTFLAACIDEDKNKCYIANVGDSRLYIFDGDKVKKVTKDHSLVEEMVINGELTPEEARQHPKKNVITRAVGVDEEVRVDTYEIDLKDIYFVFLCSDGLSNMVEERAMIHEVKTKELDDACRELVSKANENGGYDNISVIIVEIKKKEGEMVC